MAARAIVARPDSPVLWGLNVAHAYLLFLSNSIRDAYRDKRPRGGIRRLAAD